MPMDSSPLCRPRQVKIYAPNFDKQMTSLNIIGFPQIVLMIDYYLQYILQRSEIYNN